MKKKLTLIVMMVVMASLLLAGCGGNSNPTSQDSQQEGDKEVVVAIYRDGDFDELDAASFNGPHFLYKMIYEGLTEDGGNGNIIPTLAESWDISEDGKTYTYHLREGVKFSDGSEFNAEAVIFNLDRWINNDRYSSLTSCYVDKMEAVDEYTVKVTYRDAAYPILLEQSYPRPNRFLSPNSIDENGEFTKPIGTGPWMLEDYEKDVEFTLVPNPYYWGEKPKIDRLRFKVITDAQSRVLALQGGEVDIIGGDLMGKIPMESINELKDNDEFEVFTTGTQCSHFITFDENNKIFQDKNVRLALNYATDKRAIAEDLFDNNGLEAKGMYQSSVPYTTDENNYGTPYDIDKANELLDDAGYVDSDGDNIREKDGVKLELKLVYSTEEFPEWKPLAEFLQSQYTNIGVKINLIPLDKNGYSNVDTETRDFDLLLKRTSSDSWVPHSSLKELFIPYAERDFSLVWTDDKLIDMVNNVLLTLDETERQTKYDELFSYISENALTVPVYYPITSFAVNTQKISGFEIGVNNYAPVEWQKLDIVQ